MLPISIKFHSLLDSDQKCNTFAANIESSQPDNQFARCTWIALCSWLWAGMAVTCCSTSSFFFLFDMRAYYASGHMLDTYSAGQKHERLCVLSYAGNMIKPDTRIVPQLQCTPKLSAVLSSCDEVQDGFWKFLVLTKWLKPMQQKWV